MVNKLLRCLSRANILNSKILEKKIKSPFMIYTDFQSVLVPKDNGKQNQNESYTNKYKKKKIACSYGYKWLFVHDKFSKPFKSYLGEDRVCNFISSMIEESRYCSDVMKTHFNKELKRIMKILRTQLNIGSVIMTILIVMLKSDSHPPKKHFLFISIIAL